ncbi:MAG: hypothetical protein KAT77_05335 [Nanoarchaeota archaeon]|nr:hypothetical protein [Nanoarchaeota archaeon]
MDVKPFEDIGLTNAEIKVYLTLLELGSTKVGPIIEKSDLQSSVVHNNLHKLIDKGLISYIKKGKIKHYKATDPSHFFDFIEEKKKNFEKIMPQLLLKQKLAKEVNEAEVYESTKGIMNSLLELIKETKPGDEFLFFSFDAETRNKEVQDFYRKLDPKRKAKKLIVKGIAPSKLRDLYTDRIKKGYMEVKFTSDVLLPNMAICNNKIALITWGQKPVAFLIHSKQLAEKHRAYFNSLWQKLS